MASPWLAAADPSFAAGYYLLKAAQLDYPHGTGGRRLGGRRAAGWSAAGAFGDAIERAADARRAL